MRPSYSRFTRTISWLLIAVMLAMQTVSFPVALWTRASALDHANIVSIIIDSDTYTGETADLVDRYAADIQATENNTRVAIFTVDPAIHPDRIAALNEKLYYEGDGSGLSNLVGTILVGKVPLPVVHADGQAFLSIYPYTDFREKNFLYSETSGKFEKAATAPLDPEPEIWHSVISPDNGDETKDRADLKAFFDKSHAFHTASDQFQPANTQNPPYVFFFDGYHDQLATSLVNWKSYQRYMDHQEDFAYARYNKHLAKELVEDMQKATDAELGEAGKKMLDSMGQTSALATMNFDLIPDIQSKLIIEKAVNPFYKVLNAKYIGDLLRYAYNSGRYGDANNGHADIASVLVAKKDELVRETLKSANDLFESMIDETIKNDVATKATILDRVSYVIGAADSSGGGGSESGDGSSGGGESGDSSTPPTILSYKNYFYGKAASEVTDPRQCTITRGSSLMVEANHAYNVMQTEADASLLASDLPSGQCFPGGIPGVMSFWGGNTPINLDTNATNAGSFAYRLKSQRYKAFVRSIYDLGGAREIPFVPALTTVPTATSPASITDGQHPPTDPDAFGENMTLRNASPMDCFDNSLVLQPYTYTETSGGGGESGGSSSATHYPTETNGTKISCITPIQALLAPPSVSSAGSCVTTETITDGPAWSGEGVTLPACGGGGESGGSGGNSVHIVYEYKTIPSIMYHKSPDEDDLVAASKGIATPSLAMDKDRYTDFLDADGAYARVDYPNLFRIEIESVDDLNPEYARGRIKTILDAASAKMNSLSYRVAATTPIDFYARLAAKPEALNAVVESVIWANLDNATAKYKFILENSLDSTSPERTPVADHKKDYEIAYMSSLGDPENMYVKVDPEKNTVTPDITAIQQASTAYRALRDASNLP